MTSHNGSRPSRNGSAGSATSRNGSAGAATSLGRLAGAAQVPGFLLQERHEGAAVELRLAGELDLAVADRVDRRIRGALASSSGSVVVDVALLSFVDLAGMRMLSGAVEAHGPRLVLAGASDSLRRFLSLCGFAERVPFAA